MPGLDLDNRYWKRNQWSRQNFPADRMSQFGRQFHPGLQRLLTHLKAVMYLGIYQP